MPDNHHAPTKRHARHAAAIAGLAAILALTLLVGLPINLQRAAFDQQTFHLPTIHAFADQLPPRDPPLNLTDYRSATTPAWHLALAAIHLTLDPFLPSTTASLRLFNALLTAALAALLAGAVATRLANTAPPTRRTVPIALLLTAPLLANLYALASAGWLLPDNAAWLLAAAALIALDRTRLSPPVIATASVAVLLAVATRQTHIWTAALLYAALWLHPIKTTPADLPDLNRSLRFLTTRLPERLASLAVAVALTIPAWALLSAFALAWGGLVPPTFQTQSNDPSTGALLPQNTGLSPAMPAVTLALLGIYAPFTLITLQRPLRHLLAKAPTKVLATTAAAAIAAAIIALVPNTTYSTDLGRSSGIWNITRRIELFDHTSPIMVALAAAGGAAIALYARLLPPTPRLLYAVAIAGPTAAHIANANAWPRYTDPIILITLALATATALAHTRTSPKASLIGPAALALLHTAVTLSKLSWQ